MSYRILASLAVLLFLSQHAGAQRIGDALLARPAGSHRIDPAVTGALEHEGAAQVIVVFAAPAALAPRTGSHHPAAAHSPAAIAEADRILGSLGNSEFRLSRRFRSAGAFAGTVTPDGIARLLDDPAVLAVGLDRRVEAQLAESVPLMNLDVLHDRGLTGTGVTVAIADTGYDSDHPDLSDDLVGERCFCTGGCCPDASGSQSGPGSAEDDNGHGTSVAGVVTSKGVVAPTGGAPDASIVAVKVLSASGGGFLSDVIAGLDWIAVDRPDVQVVNLSLATTTLYDGDCDEADAATMAFSAVIGALTARGVTVFAATGNAGSSTRMPLPACIAGAVSVAGVWDSNFGGPFNLGPCVEATTAPDQLVCSSNANAQTDLVAPAGPMTAPRIGGGTGLFFGASYAAPGAASCAAVLLQYDRALSPGAIEAALESSPTRVPDLRNGLDYPRVDCAEALDYIRAHTPRRTAPAVSSAALAFLAGAFAALGIFLLRTGKYGAKRG